MAGEDVFKDLMNDTFSWISCEALIWWSNLQVSIQWYSNVVLLLTLLYKRAQVQ